MKQIKEELSKEVSARGKEVNDGNTTMHTKGC